MSVIQLGARSQLVGHVQQRLLEAGYVIAEQELLGGIYGPGTARAVGEFQRSRGLKDDQIVGPLTMAALTGAPDPRSRATMPGWRCYPSEIRHAVRNAVEAAVRDLGTAEDPPGSNAGPGLAKYPGHIPGLPWCAYALSWWLSHVEDGCPWDVLGSALKILTWAREERKILHEAALPEPGDVWLRMRTEIAGHVSLIVHRDGTHRLSTVGGNEGGRVSGLIRSRFDATAIVRPVGLD